jgi:hypothetical protein
MVLRESLVEADIPHRDKMRESIISGWQQSFEELKLDLSVSTECFSSLFLLANFDR